MKKSSSPSRIAPLQRVVSEPVTDPIELAALNELCRQTSLRLQNGQDQEGIETQAELTWRVIALCRQLPAADAAWLLPQVVSLVSGEEMLAWTENLLHHLAPDTLMQLEKQLAERLAAKAGIG